MKPEAVAALEVLDMDTVQQLMDLDDGGTGLLSEMAGLFRDDTPSRLRQLEAAIQTDDHQQIGDMAHAVKGAASTMGAPRVRALAQTLEASARVKHYEESPAVLAQRLDTAFLEAVAALESYLASKS